jgi:hypothetical protein
MIHFPSPLLGTWPGFAPAFSTKRAGREINRRTVPAATISAVIFSTLKQGMYAASTERLEGIGTIPADGKHPVVSGNLISRPDVD